LTDRCITIAPSFAGLNTTSHTAQVWNDGTYRLSWTTLPWSAQAIAQILRKPELSKNKVFPVRAFEASQRDVVAALEQAQGVKYQISHIDGEKAIEESKRKWSEGDVNGLYTLVAAGFFTPGFGSNLVDDGIVEVGSDRLDLPKVTLEEVVEEAVKAL
jgi:hypothetical protein